MDVLEFISNDVLVIGGGAGLCAAISTRKEGAGVLLVSKGPPGRANNTVVSVGSFAVATGLWGNVIHLNNIYWIYLLQAGGLTALIWFVPWYLRPNTHFVVKLLTYNEAKVIVIEKVYLKCIL